MSEYTPTTEEMRALYTAERLDGPHLDGFPAPTIQQAEAEFDRWLAAHDADVRAGVVAEEPTAHDLLDAIYDPEEDSENDSVRFGYVVEQYERLKGARR
jgi:hypothetical protein